MGEARRKRLAEGIETGRLDILSTGHGHSKLTFHKGNAEEMAKAKRVIEDMLKRGYSIFVEVGEDLKRVKRFDPKKLEYILLDVPADEVPAQADPGACWCGRTPARHRGAHKGSRQKRVPVAAARATALGRSAGG